MKQEPFHRMRHRHHPGDGPPLAGAEGCQGPGFRHGREFYEGPGRRARRGEARFLLLDALRDGPKHGYEIIKTLEERSGGRYAPSPGTVYPTLQMLEDLGLVGAGMEGEKRVFHLTDEGRAELETHSDQIDGFWQRFRTPEDNGCQTELRFLRDELEHLERTVWSGLRHAIEGEDIETIRGVRGLIETCQSEVRRLAGEKGR